MTTLPQEPVTREQFIAWEQYQESRHELVAGRISYFPGVTIEHSTIAGAVFVALVTHVGDGPCRVHGADMMIETCRGIRYSDGVVTCDEGDRIPNIRTLRAPKLIVEVLSESTAAVDRGAKLDEYRAIPSLEEYVLIDSRKRWATAHRRIQGEWRASQPIVAGELSFASVGLALDLDRIYRKAGVDA